MCKKIQIFGLYTVYFNSYTVWVKSPFGIKICGYNATNNTVYGDFRAVTIADAALSRLAKKS